VSLALRDERVYVGRTAPEMPISKKRHQSETKLHYAWIVAGITFVVLLTAGAVRGSSGLLILPLEAEFHWSRAEISLAVGVNLFTYGLIGPFAATVMETLGLARAIMGALVCVVVGVLLTATMQHVWQLILLWGVLVGSGTGMMASVLAAMVASRWFEARRGLVTGLLTAAAAAGQLLCLPLFAEVTSTLGWRWMCALIGLLALILIPLVALIMRDRPADIGISKYGATSGSLLAEVTRSRGNPMRVAFEVLFTCAHSRDFWLIAGSIFICGASTQGLIGTHLIPACMDHGVPELAAASLLGGMAVFNIAGATASGWLSDRLDPRILLAVYYTARGASLIYLPSAFESFYGLSAFTIFYGLDWIATIPATIRLSATSFGPERGTIVFGWIMAIHQVGGALAAFLAGIARLDLGTYLQAFVCAGLMCFAAAALVVFIRREPMISPARG